MDNQDQHEPAARNQPRLVVYCCNDHTCGSSTSQGNGENKDHEAYFDSFPVGYRFMPSDHELIQYLRKKINNEPLPRNQIREVELYNHDPETLAAMYKTKRMDELYFFTSRNRKYPNGGRPNRALINGKGYWKATGADKGIEVNKNIVGLKKPLVFYIGKPPDGTKTNWIMHEYTLADLPKRQQTSPTDMKLDDWVLCKIRKNVNNAERNAEAESKANDQDTKTEMNQVQNPGAAVAEASLIGTRGSSIQQLQMLTHQASLPQQENVFASSSVSADNYSYGEAGASSQMQAPSVEDNAFSAYAQQLEPIEDLAQWANDPLLTQTNPESLELFFDEHFPPHPENGVFDIPPWDPLYSSTKDEKDTRKN